MLAVVLVCCAATLLQVADLQSIQDARPLNVDLSSQSDTALANSAGTEIDEPNLGGYRPLYPPYFLREPTTQSSVVQPKSVYYDQEYYTRGAHPGITDDRLDRQLKIAAGNPFLPSTRSGTTFPVAQPQPVIPEAGATFGVAPPTVESGFQPVLTDDRGNRQIKITSSRFSHAASSSFSSSYSFHSLRFPSS